MHQRRISTRQAAIKVAAIVSGMAGADSSATNEVKIAYAFANPDEMCACQRTDASGQEDPSGAISMHDNCPNCYMKALGVLDKVSDTQAADILRGTVQSLGITDKSEIDDVLDAFKQLGMSIPGKGSAGGRRTRGKKGKRSGSRKKRATRGKKRAGKKRSGSKRSGSKRSGSKRTRRR
jgi:hypothetical protein